MDVRLPCSTIGTDHRVSCKGVLGWREGIHGDKQVVSERQALDQELWAWQPKATVDNQEQPLAAAACFRSG